MIVVDFKDGSALLFEDYKQFEDSPYEEYDSNGWYPVKKYNPNADFTRYWVSLRINKDNNITCDNGEDVHKIADLASMRADRVMNDSWNAKLHFGVKSAYGAGHSYEEALLHAAKGIAELCE